ncbi:hypothetical protein N9279_00525, partial [bacterium]|nr:hypothetical protein [bacterium]
EGRLSKLEELLLGDLEAVGGEGFKSVGKAGLDGVEEVGGLKMAGLQGLDLMLEFALALEEDRLGVAEFSEVVFEACFGGFEFGDGLHGAFFSLAGSGIYGAEPHHENEEGEKEAPDGGSGDEGEFLGGKCGEHGIRLLRLIWEVLS